MADTNAAYSAFETLWKKANDPTLDIKPYVVEGVETDVQVMFLLPHITRLADSLNSAKIIDEKQHEKMLTAVAHLRDVIKTIDHEVLSDVMKSLK